VVVVGRATRLATFAGGWAKSYEGVIRLGITTDTDDATGAVVASAPADGVSAGQLAAALAGFRGGYLQRPPAYSAVKIAGERAYRRARRGELVEPAARRVEIAELEMMDYAVPDVRFRATVSGGTYLRSLARDIGTALGCGAHLGTLRRTAVGPLRLADAVPPDAVTPALVRDPSVLVAHLPRRDADDAERDAIVHGRPIAAGLGTRASGLGEPSTSPEPRAPSPVAVFANGILVAVADVQGEVLKPRVVVTDA